MTRSPTSAIEALRHFACYPADWDRLPDTARLLVQVEPVPRGRSLKSAHWRMADLRRAAEIVSVADFLERTADPSSKTPASRVGAISDQDGQPKPNPNPTTPRQDDERPG